MRKIFVKMCIKSVKIKIRRKKFSMENEITGVCIKSKLEIYA